jgi:SAM-dependent methyltransferase
VKLTGEADPATAAALARLYDLDLLEDPGDLDLYLALADRVAGPILELAVGSGRLAVPIAEAGFAVSGVDLDPQMLERARSRAEEAGSEVTGRLTLVEADLTTVRLPGAGTFGLAFIALNSLLVLAGRDAQRAALRTMAYHLAPGGVAAVDVWIPDADELGRFDGRMHLEWQRRDGATGEIVTKTASAQHDATAGTVTMTTIFESSAQGGGSRRWLREDRFRLAGGDDLRTFAEEAGLVVETIAGDLGLGPLGPGSERAIVIARRG